MAQQTKPSVEVNKLTKIESVLNARQIQRFFDRTPASKIYTRPAKGGGMWKYVKASYVVDVLNSLFGHNWSFRVLTPMKDAFEIAQQTGTLVVQVELTCTVEGEPIIKQQFGRADVKFIKASQKPLDIGNDFKAAASDGLKKCASTFGLFRDVYAPDDFLDLTVVDEPKPTDADRLAAAREEVRKKLNEQLKEQPNEDNQHITDQSA